MTPERIKEARGRLEFYRRDLNAFLVDDVNAALDAIERVKALADVYRPAKNDDFESGWYGGLQAAVAALEGKPE